MIIEISILLKLTSTSSPLP